MLCRSSLSNQVRRLCLDSIPVSVRVVEVGPRDGLQNEPARIPTATKVRLIERLTTCGVRHVECASFVSARWVPQMADSGEVLEQLERRPGVTYSALVPNEQGLDAALRSQVHHVAVFTAASDQFSRRNTNCSGREGVERAGLVAGRARDAGIPVRGYVSCACGCPYEGVVSAAAVARVSARLMELGCSEVCLGDTIGVATPASLIAVVKAVVNAGVPINQLAIHCHDTYGQALSNVLAALEMGVSTIDSSVAGLGGCPYAEGATGNLATEDLVYMLHGLGVSTGINLTELARTGAFICQQLGRANSSKAGSVIASRHPEQQQEH